MTTKIKPVVDFQVHEAIIQAFFFPKFYGKDKIGMEADLGEFIALFKPCEEKILMLIEKYSGFSWTKDRIPVFLIPRNQIIPYSYARPGLQDGLPGILQKVTPNRIRDFHIFIHELSHVNQKQSDFHSEKYGVLDSKGERNLDLIELGADLVTIQILVELFGENSVYELDRIDFMTNTNEKNRRKNEMTEKHRNKWDLSKNTLKYYLQHA